MLEQEPDPNDPGARYSDLIDYSTSILDKFLDPPVPKKIADRVRIGLEKICKEIGEDPSEDRQIWGILTRMPYLPGQ